MNLKPYDTNVLKLGWIGVVKLFIRYVDKLTVQFVLE